MLLPLLDDLSGHTASKHGLIEALPDGWQELLHPLPAFQKTLKRPLPILFQIPAQVFALLERERFHQEIAHMAQSQYLATKRHVGDLFRQRAHWWGREGDTKIERLVHGAFSPNTLESVLNFF